MQTKSWRRWPQKTPTAPYLYWPVMIAQMASQPERYLKVAALLS